MKLMLQCCCWNAPHERLDGGQQLPCDLQGGAKSGALVCVGLLGVPFLGRRLPNHSTSFKLRAPEAEGRHPGSFCLGVPGPCRKKCHAKPLTSFPGPPASKLREAGTVRKGKVLLLQTAKGLAALAHHSFFRHLRPLNIYKPGPFRLAGGTACSSFRSGQQTWGQLHPIQSGALISWQTQADATVSVWRR